ncbi:MAG: hypothetical protein Aurels2KO_32630 [Aureliella sp.]
MPETLVEPLKRWVASRQVLRFATWFVAFLTRAKKLHRARSNPVGGWVVKMVGWASSKQNNYLNLSAFWMTNRVE